MKITIVFISSLLLALSFVIASLAANPIDDLKPGEWYEISNSRLDQSGVFPPNPVPPGTPEFFMGAWNGGAYDTKRDRLIIWGGGHNDYGGNEIYTFDINTFRWSRIWGPSSNIPPIGPPCSETYSDRNPASRHTYDGLVYIPTLDKFWSSNGSLYCGSGGGAIGAWMFDLNNLTWLRRADTISNHVSVHSDYDPVSGNIFTGGDKSTVAKYNPTNNTWTQIGTMSGLAFGEEMSGVIDPVKRMFVAVGNGYIYAFNIDTGQRFLPTVSGGSAVMSARGPALVYDSTTQRIIGWGGGTSVYSLDTTNWTWTEYQASVSNTVTPTAPTRVGVFGRFQYIPSKNVFIVVNSIDENVYIYKLSSGTGTPSSPDTQAPTAPTNLSATAISSSQVNLSWTASNDNVGVTGYRIYRGGSQIGTSATNSYSDTGLSPSTSYSYNVSAYDASGNISGQSSSASAATQAATGGRTINATPSNYESLLSTLLPGDTLILSAGNYYGMSVYNLNGTANQQIIITGPTSGSAAVILGSSGENTVRIDSSSYVTMKNLEIDSRNLGGDPVNGQGVSHHITLENLYIHGFSDDQGTVGISTNRAPVWNWTIRNNTITDGGTGMYLGNSDGNEQFLSGLIENNLIYDTIGYNAEFKHQNPLPANIFGLPLTTTKTIIRNNVFSKANNASIGGMARPNLLVGHAPLSGSGQDNYYEIYGNFFYQNPTGEPLFQGEGNVAFYNNLLFNSVDPTGAYPAVYIAPHNDKPRDVRVFNNTIVSKNSGISISGGYSNFQQKVIGNAVFSATTIQAPDQNDNITDTYQNAGNYLANPFASLGTFDLFPKPGKLIGTQIDVSSVNTFTDWNKDFNGTTHTGVFRGAYEGEGQNSGWLPKLEIKPITQSQLKGDINQDSAVDILDVQACVNHILGAQDWGSAADINNDGSVDVLDVQAIVNIILGV